MLPAYLHSRDGYFLYHTVAVNVSSNATVEKIALLTNLKHLFDNMVD